MQLILKALKGVSKVRHADDNQPHFMGRDVLAFQNIRLWPHMSCDKFQGAVKVVTTPNPTTLLMRIPL